MKILIGTPVHQVKDYSMQRWLENVTQLTSITPADLLIVDNSPTPDYALTLKKYCAQTGVVHSEILHLDFPKNASLDLKIEYSQEVIRQHCLSHHYNYWFSWECDQIIPTNALDKLLKIMDNENYGMVIANSWARWDPNLPNTNMGVTLISRRCLEKNWFLPMKEGRISLDPKDTYDINTYEYKRRVLNNAESYLEIYGLIKPIYHLNN